MQLMVLLPSVKINYFMMGSQDQRRLYCSSSAVSKPQNLQCFKYIQISKSIIPVFD